MNNFNAKEAFYTLLKKEVLRFKRVAFHTVAAPVLSSLLYLAVFGAVLDDKSGVSSSGAYLEFLIPGLVMMAVVQNAFANTSSSFIQSKISGTLTFLLTTPQSSSLIAIAYILAASLRGLFVGICVWFGTLLWVKVLPVSIVWPVLFLFFGSLLMGALGLITAIVADRYEQMGVIQTFVVMPLTFLSGVFYSITALPPLWQKLTTYNPVYYLIDGFRGGFIGAFEVDPLYSFCCVLSVTLFSFWVSTQLLKSGYKTKK